MTYQNLIFKISQLIEKRNNAQGNDFEQKRINEKLSKLYELKYLMLTQGV